MASVKSKLLLISSQDKREGETHSNFSVSIENAYLNNVMGIELANFRSLNTYYNINQYNNVWTFEVNSLPQNVTLEYGDYDIDSLIGAIELQTALVTLEVENPTKKLLFTTITPTDDITLLKNSPMSNLLGILSDNIATGTISSDIVPDLSGLNVIRISSNISRHNSISSDGSHSNVFTKIMVEPGSSFGKPIEFISSSSDQHTNVNYTQPHNLQGHLQFTLKDQNDNEVHFQRPVFMTLKLYY